MSWCPVRHESHYNRSKLHMDMSRRQRVKSRRGNVYNVYTVTLPLIRMRTLWDLTKSAESRTWYFKVVRWFRSLFFWSTQPARCGARTFLTVHGFTVVSLTCFFFYTYFGVSAGHAHFWNTTAYPGGALHHVVWGRKNLRTKTNKLSH